LEGVSKQKLSSKTTGLIYANMKKVVSALMWWGQQRSNTWDKYRKVFLRRSERNWLVTLSGTFSGDGKSLKNMRTGIWIKSCFKQTRLQHFIIYVYIYIIYNVVYAYNIS
jgi:hypothetical protein